MQKIHIFKLFKRISLYAELFPGMWRTLTLIWQEKIATKSFCSNFPNLRECFSFHLRITYFSQFLRGFFSNLHLLCCRFFHWFSICSPWTVHSGQMSFLNILKRLNILFQKICIVAIGFHACNSFFTGWFIMQWWFSFSFNQSFYCMIFFFINYHIICVACTKITLMLNPMCRNLLDIVFDLSFPKN